MLFVNRLPHRGLLGIMFLMSLVLFANADRPQRRSLTITVHQVGSTPNWRTYSFRGLGVQTKMPISVTSESYRVGPADLAHFPYNSRNDAMLSPAMKKARNEDGSWNLVALNALLLKGCKRDNTTAIRALARFSKAKALILRNLAKQEGVYEAMFSGDGLVIHLDRKRGCFRPSDPESAGKIPQESYIIGLLLKFGRVDWKHFSMKYVEG